MFSKNIINITSNLMPTQIRHAFYDIGKKLVADTKTYFDEPKSGKTYLKRFRAERRVKLGTTLTRLKNAKKYVASAPYESPAKVTGTLKASVNFLVEGTARLLFRVDQERYGCEYGKYLEYKDLVNQKGQGSKNIKPRPFISRAYHANKEFMRNRFLQSIREANKK